MISVVVPVYNCEKYLKECLESLSAQTIKEFEIILVDDGSTDSSGCICDEFAQKHSLCKVIHTENQGPFLARQVGIAHSSGDYVMSLDSDDCFRADAVQIVSKVCKECSPDIICFNLSRGVKPTFEGELLLPVLPHSGLYESEAYSSIRIAACAGTFNNLESKVVKRSVLDFSIFSSIRANLKHGEDWLATLSVVDGAKSLYYIDQALSFYRKNDQSLSLSFKPYQVDDLSIVFDYLIKYATKWGDECKAAALRGICQHCYWLIQGMALEKDRKRFVPDAAKVADLMRNKCGDRLASTVSSMRLDFRIVLRLLLSGAYAIALHLTHMEWTLYNWFK